MSLILELFRLKKERKLRSIISWSLIGLLSCFITLSYPYLALGQLRSVPSPSKVESGDSLFNRASDVINVGNIYAATVRLDGYELFKVTASDGVETNLSENLIPPSQFARLRAQLVENELKGIVSNHLYGGTFHQGFQKETLTVTVAQRNGLTVVVAYDDDRLRERQIVTVTEEDAQYYGDSVESWAQKLAQIIKEALLRAQLERSQNYTINRLIWSVIVVAIAIALSWGLSSFQKRLRKQRLVLKAEEPVNELVLSPSELSSFKKELSMAAEQKKFLKVREKQQEFARKLEWIRLKRRLLQSGHFIIWTITLLFIVDLFPGSRWLSFVFLEKPLMLLIVFFGITVIMRLVSILIDRYLQTLIEEASICPIVCSGLSQRRSSRLSTMAEISKDFISWVLTGIAIVIVLDILELPIGTLLTGAGVFGIAISFVAQNFIKDLINGIQILHQDHYVIGDFIQVGETWGLVEGFTLTVTQIRGRQGRLTTVPNGDIRVVHNLTKEWARIDLYIKISHETNVDLAMEVMQQTAVQMQQDPEWCEFILEPTVLMGVHNFDHTGVEIQYWMKTQPMQQWAVGREFRRRLKIAFDEKGINLGIPQESRVMQNNSSFITIRDNGVN